jgi:hypothetical protein
MYCADHEVAGLFLLQALLLRLDPNLCVELILQLGVLGVRLLLRLPLPPLVLLRLHDEFLPVFLLLQLLSIFLVGIGPIESTLKVAGK